MLSLKIFLSLVSFLVLSVSGITSALARYEPNDNYSSLILSYHASTFANPVCLGTAGTECHQGISGPAVVFVQQIIPNLALGLSGSYLQSKGNTSSITAKNGAAFVEGIVGLGRQVDVGASAALLSTNIELCSSVPDSCNSISDSGNDLGVFGKVFLTENRAVSVALSYNAVSFKQSSDQSIVGLSVVSVFARRHRLALSYESIRDSSNYAVSSGFGVSYSYLVF